ncbi:hypothetical protein B2K_11770 [Paenibacillus mucilaginosus K02]|uniref:Uncharacterized protein n=1 Tax=Paenibacillus mucilaginosus K02 TaxID=997761 RepID=I0BG93_9BACL|nr:hypothetical protein B2K_11770 [Paenibacillus mucilaginosus K02]
MQDYRIGVFDLLIVLEGTLYIGEADRQWELQPWDMLRLFSRGIAADRGHQFTYVSQKTFQISAIIFSYPS